MTGFESCINNGDRIGAVRAHIYDNNPGVRLDDITPQMTDAAIIALDNAMRFRRVRVAESLEHEMR
jgi:hypothetical protein